MPASAVTSGGARCTGGHRSPHGLEEHPRSVARRADGGAVRGRRRARSRGRRPRLGRARRYGRSRRQRPRGGDVRERGEGLHARCVSRAAADATRPSGCATQRPDGHVHASSDDGSAPVRRIIRVRPRSRARTTPGRGSLVERSLSSPLAPGYAVGRRSQQAGATAGHLRGEHELSPRSRRECRYGGQATAAATANGHQLADVSSREFQRCADVGLACSACGRVSRARTGPRCRCGRRARAGSAGSGRRPSPLPAGSRTRNDEQRRRCRHRADPTTNRATR